MDFSPVFLASRCANMRVSNLKVPNEKESMKHSMFISIDLAKNVFEGAVRIDVIGSRTDAEWKYGSGV